MHSQKCQDSSVEGGKAVGSTEGNASANVNGSHQARRLAYNCARPYFCSDLYSLNLGKLLRIFIFIVGKQ